LQNGDAEFDDTDTRHDGAEHDPKQQTADGEVEKERAEGDRSRLAGAEEHPLKNANVRFAHDANVIER